MKQPGERVTLTASFWDCPEPVAGDAIETSTGRRYEIIEKRGQRIDCRVLHPDARLMDGARVFHWQWNARPTKRNRKS